MDEKTGNFKTVTKESRVNRNVVPADNSTNLMDCKEINKSVLREAETTRSLINRICLRQATSFGHVMRREKKILVTAGKIEAKRSKGKQRERYWMH